MVDLNSVHKFIRVFFKEGVWPAADGKKEWLMVARLVLRTGGAQIGRVIVSGSAKLGWEGPVVRSSKTIIHLLLWPLSSWRHC